MAVLAVAVPLLAVTGGPESPTTDPVQMAVASGTPIRPKIAATAPRAAITTFVTTAPALTPRDYSVIKSVNDGAVLTPVGLPVPGARLAPPQSPSGGSILP